MIVPRDPIRMRYIPVWERVDGARKMMKLNCHIFLILKGSQLTKTIHAHSMQLKGEKSFCVRYVPIPWAPGIARELPWRSLPERQERS